MKRKYLTAGALAGLINGFFGAGGGIVLTPLLLSWIGLESKKAFATSVFIILPISAVSAALYLWQGRVDFPAALRLLNGIFHRRSDAVGVKDNLPFCVSSRPSNGLDQAGFTAQKAFLIGVQNANQTDFGNVQSFPQ